MDVEDRRKPHDRTQTCARRPCGGEAVSQAASQVGHAWPLVQGQYLDACNASLIERAEEKFAAPAVLDEVIPRLCHDQSQFAGFRLAETQTPGQRGSNPSRLAHLTRFGDRQGNRLVANQIISTS